MFRRASPITSEPSEPSVSRQDSLAHGEVNIKLGAIPRVPKNTAANSEVERTSSPEPRIRRRKSLRASIEKIRSKVTSVVDRVNASFSENTEAMDEEKKAVSSVNEIFASEMNADRILPSGEIRRKKLESIVSMMKTLKPQNLFKKSNEQKDRGMETLSESSSCSSSPSLTSMEYYIESTPAIDSTSGKVRMYDDIKHSIVCRPFSNKISDEVHSELNEVVSDPSIPEDIDDTLSDFFCFPDNSSWTNEKFDTLEEGEYLMIKRECPCAAELDQQEDATKNNSELEEIDGFVMVNQ